MCLLVIFFFEVFLSISSHFPSVGFYLFMGPQEFWAMGLTFLLYLRDVDAVNRTLEHYLYHGLGDGAT